MPHTATNSKRPATQLRASPMVLGIAPVQLRGRSATAVARSYRHAARLLLELADELDGASPTAWVQASDAAAAVVAKLGGAK